MRFVPKPLSNERGMALIIEMVLAVLVIGAGGYAVYRAANHSSTKSTKSNAATTTASTTEDSSCLATYHDADLCHFAGNSTSLEKLAYTATISNTQAGTTSTMTLKNDGKGNTALSGTANGATFNSIELAGATYLEANGSWIKYPAGASSAAPSDPASSMNIGVGATGISYKKIDTEACGSLTCFKYQVIDSVTPTVTQYAWFDNSSYRLREWKYSDGSGNATDMTLSYAPVTITAPSPVEDFSTAAGQ